MTEEQAKASNLNLDFNNVDEAASINVTQPGTIAVFKIRETEYVESTEKKTPGLKCTFEEIGDHPTEFNHTFWLTSGALPRIQTLAKYALKQKLVGSSSGAQLMAMFKDKALPLKVTASINDQKGKVYPDLPFGGFSAEKVEDLAFNAKEKAEIERSKSVVEKSNVGNADTEIQPAATASQSDADDF